MPNIDRNDWIANHKHEFPKHFQPVTTGQAKGPKWATLAMTWTNANGDKTFVMKRIVNLKTLEMYWPDSKELIWYKCCVLSFGRPLHTIAKTIYHVAFPLSMSIEAIRAIITRDPNDTPKEVAWKALVYAGRSLADIGRVPIAGIALTAIAMTGAAVAPFLYCCKPDFIYDIREAASKIENWMNWGDRKAPPFAYILAPCFQSIDPFAFQKKAKYQQEYADTTYLSHDPIFVAMNNYVRARTNAHDASLDITEN